MPYYLSPPPQNPLARVIAGIVAILTVAGAFMIGMVALTVVAGVALIAGLAIWLRVVWIKRQLRKSGVDLGSHIRSPGRSPGTRKPDVSGQVIEAEYTVVSESDDENENAR
jgi:hypothetical protein